MWGWLIALLARLLYSEPTVVQRGSGDPVIERVPPTIRAQLGLLYNTWAGWALCQTPWLRRYQLWHSEDLGRRYDAPESRAAIPGFIKVRLSPAPVLRLAATPGGTGAHLPGLLPAGAAAATRSPKGSRLYTVHGFTPPAGLWHTAGRAG